MKVVKIAVPDCYGTYEEASCVIEDGECCAEYFCRQLTWEKQALNKSNPTKERV